VLFLFCQNHNNKALSSIPNISHELEHRSIGKLLWHYSFPTIIGTLVNALYNIVDRIFIGQGVGAYAISGLALTFPIMMILGAVGMLIGQGAATRISISLGKKDVESAKTILCNAVILTLIASGSIIVFTYIFLDEILVLFGGTDTIIPYAKEYMQIILLGHILTTFSFGFNNIMRASGYPIKAMCTMLIGACLNVILDPIFIFVLDLGIKGAAISTVISMTVTSMWVLLHFMNKNHIVHFEKSGFHLQKHVVWAIIAIGFSPFCVQIATSLVNIFMNITLEKYGGELAIGAFGIITSFSTLIIMAIVGLTNGMQPIIGYNYGAQQNKRVRETLRYVIIVALALTTIGCLCAQIFPDSIASFFTSDETLIKITAHGIHLSLMMFFMVGFQLVVTSFFQSIGKVNTSILLSITRQILFLFPLLWLFPNIWGLDGAWAAHSIADLLSAIVAGIALTLQIKKLKSIQCE
jgi:putative MATE family efflux protein